MEKDFLLKNCAKIFLVLVFTFPFVHLFTYVGLLDLTLDPYLFRSLYSSTIQAFFSATLTLLFGYLGALGLFDLQRRWSSSLYGLAEILALAPSFLPPIILVILSVKTWNHFPYGLWGVIILHVIVNIGLVAVMLQRVMKTKSLPWAELATIEGISPWRFHFYNIVNLRRDLFLLFIFVFIMCFMSFSIPFLVGGAQYGGIEVFIYEKIFLFGDWGQALTLSLALTIFFVALSFVIRPSLQPQYAFQGRHSSVRLICARWPNLIVFAPLFLLISSFFGSDYAINGVAMRGTFIVGLGTGLTSFLLLSLISFVYLGGWQARALFSFVPPGWMIIGFSFFLLGSNAPTWSFFKVMVALSLIFVPYLYRLKLFAATQDLRAQVDVARLTGKGWNSIFFKVIWPQILPLISLLSGVSALWASGDFAISSVVLSRDLTLALQMKSLMLNYRLDQALGMVPSLLLASLLVFLFFQGLSNVCRKKIA